MAGMLATTGRLRDKLVRKGMPTAEVEAELRRLEAGRGIAVAKRLRWRLRYLSDGAVIGQRSFVDEVFRQCRDQFGEPSSSKYWNLGPTGMQGWFHHASASTNESRQILVTTVVAGSPADGILAVNDVILV